MGVLVLVVFGLGLAQWAEGADAIDKEEKQKVRAESPRLIIPSDSIRILSEVEADYSHIRI